MLIPGVIVASTQNETTGTSFSFVKSSYLNDSVIPLLLVKLKKQYGYVNSLLFLGV